MPPSSKAFSISSRRAPQHSDDDDDYDDRRKRTAASASSAARPHSSSSKTKRYAEDLSVDDVRAVKKQNASSSRRDTVNHDEVSDAEAESGTWSAQLLLERKAYDQWMDSKMSKISPRREQRLQDRIDSISAERDQVQSQYEELRQLRHTGPERALDEFKRTAESKFRHDRDTIASLKKRAELNVKRSRGSADADGSISMHDIDSHANVLPDSPDRKMQDLEKKHRRELADAARIRKQLEEDVKTYKLQLEQEIAQSKALLQGGSSSAQSGRNIKPAPSSVPELLPAHEDEKAVRKLYEDITGIVITGVENIRIDHSAKIVPSKPYKRYKAIFAQEGYHSLLFDLEESQSTVRDDETGKNFARQDIVYIPKLDDDRDKDLLEDEGVPQAWKESLRFVKTSMFNWYDKTRKILRTEDPRRHR